MEARTATRRPDVDWLRVLATYLLFAFHAGKVFDVPPYYHLKNEVLSPAMGYFTGFVHQWHMPLFFVLAGWSLAGSLRVRGATGVLRERVSRLVVPLAFGMLVLCPFLRWVELRSGQFSTLSGVHLPAEPGVGFLAFLPRYYTLEGLSWAHLWFVAYLFVFTALYLPLLARVSRAPLAGRRLSVFWLYAPLVPLALVQVTLRDRWPGYQNLIDDWANFSYYSLFFLLGFALSRLPELERLAQSEWKRAGLAALAALLAMVGTDFARAAGLPLATLANRALSAVAGWCGVVFLLGLAARHLRRSGPWLTYLAESAFPVYVLHQVGVVAVAVFIVGLPLGVPAKFALLVSVSLLATLAVYHFVVRPVGVLRLLHGMKPRRAATSARTAPPGDQPAGGATARRVAACGLLPLAFALFAPFVGCDRGSALAPASNAAMPTTADWPVYGGDAGGTRHSPLAEITPANVSHLQVAWTFHTGDVSDGSQTHGWKTSFQATPLVVDGTLYFPSPLGRVFALDPETGVQRWVYDTKLDRTGRYSESTSRGVATWLDPRRKDGEPCRRRILYATLDARLFALDARTGEPCADFSNGGFVDLKRGMGAERLGEYQITSPPAVIGERVVVGSAISDNQRTNAPSGVVRAFEVRTGAQLWAFDPIPRDSRDPAAKTWEDDSARRTGAANAWSILSVDEARDLVFVPTGSPSPDYYGGERKGDDRYANSVVALRGSTGQVVWSFQVVHHDLWDFDVPAQPVLVTLKRDGVDVPAVVQATKMGLLFVLHRETGAPLFPVEERPVPASDVPGEQASPTQPFPVAPPPLVPQRLRPEDAWGVTPWDRSRCRDAIAKLRNEGIYTPPSLRGTLAFPGIAGGTNWGSVAFDPERRLVLVNTTRAAFQVTLVPRDEFQARRERERDDHTLEFAPQAGTPYGMVRGPVLSPLGMPCNAPPWGALSAIDLSDGTVRWEAPLGTPRDLAPIPIWFATGTPNLGGPLSTAGGLVFIGAAMDDYLRAFDVETGRELWKARLPAGGQATPMTYRVRPDGRQFVVIAAGGHGKLGTRLGDALVAFALP
jgi:quinoprotein glucose dehydrogenase